MVTSELAKSILAQIESAASYSHHTGLTFDDLWETSLAPALNKAKVHPDDLVELREVCQGLWEMNTIHVAV